MPGLGAVQPPRWKYFPQKLRGSRQLVLEVSEISLPCLHFSALTLPSNVATHQTIFFPGCLNSQTLRLPLPQVPEPQCVPNPQIPPCSQTQNTSKNPCTPPPPTSQISQLPVPTSSMARLPSLPRSLNSELLNCQFQAHSKLSTLHSGSLSSQMPILSSQFSFVNCSFAQNACQVSSLNSHLSIAQLPNHELPNVNCQVLRSHLKSLNGQVPKSPLSNPHFLNSNGQISNLRSHSSNLTSQLLNCQNLMSAITISLKGLRLAHYKSL